MWRVDDCFIHGCVFCYWMCRSDVSVIPFRMCIFFNHSFWPCCYGLLTYPCLREISFLDDKWNCQLVIGFR